MKVGAGDFIEAGNTGRNRSGQERDQEVNFSEDKCEVSLPCPGLFQSCRAEREKTKGHLKKWFRNILETEWNKKPSQSVPEQPCYWHDVSLAAVVWDAVNWASNTKLLCLALRQSRCRPWAQNPPLPACATPTAQLCRPAVAWVPSPSPGRGGFRSAVGALGACHQRPEPSASSVSSLATACSSALGPLCRPDEGRVRGIWVVLAREDHSFKLPWQPIGLLRSFEVHYWLSGQFWP